MHSPRFRCSRRLAAVFALLFVLASEVVRAEDDTLGIFVRTTVGSGSGKTMGARKTFSIFPPTEVASAERLARPVAPEAIRGMTVLLDEKLRAQGLVGANAKDRPPPELLITVQYGRGYLTNPYALGTVVNESIGGGATVSSVAGGGDYMRTKEPGYEAKRQLAGFEKLFFTIAAWDFASMQKGGKPVKFWTTTIYVDDPDHRDLGQLYSQMLDAGAEFFNRRLEREEVEITTKLRGRVDVGTPRVVPEAPPKK